MSDTIVGQAELLASRAILRTESCLDRWNQGASSALLGRKNSSKGVHLMGKLEQAWNKAEACERHAQATTDNKLKVAFRKPRDSWIRIGNAAQLEGNLETQNKQKPH